MFIDEDYVQKMYDKRELENKLLKLRYELTNERVNFKRASNFLNHLKESENIDIENSLYYELGSLDKRPYKSVYLENQAEEYQKLYDESKQKVNDLTKSIDDLSLQIKEYEGISKEYDQLFSSKLALLKENEDYDLFEIDRLVTRSITYKKLLQSNKRAIRLTNELSNNGDDLILFYDTYTNLHYRVVFTSMANVMNNYYDDWQQLCVRIEGMSSNMEDTYKELESILLGIDDILDTNFIPNASNQKVIEYIGPKMKFSIEGKYTFSEKMIRLFRSRSSEFEIKQGRIVENMETVTRWRKYAPKMIELLIEDIMLYSKELNKIENRLDQLVMKE